MHRMVINDLTLNQDCSCILISTSEYHKIFNCEPFGEFYSSNQAHGRRSISNTLDPPGSHQPLAGSNGYTPAATPAPTAFLKMLFSTSLTIIIPQSAKGNRLLRIYNLKQNLKICELTFLSDILNIKLNRKRLLVFLDGEIYIYDLSCVRLLKVLEVARGPDGGPSLGSAGSAGHSLGVSSRTLGYSSVLGDLTSHDLSWLVLPLRAITDQTDLLNQNQTKTQNHVNNQTNSNQTNMNQNKQTNTNQTSSSPNNLTNSFHNQNTKTETSNIPELSSLITLTPKNESSSILKLMPNVSLQDLKNDGNGWVILYDTINLVPRLIFKAHNSSLAKITISPDNSTIATASSKGTIIRVFKLNEVDDKLAISHVINLRRGHNPARINSLTFNSDNSILGCGSESNTIHFFRLTDEVESDFDDEEDELEGSKSSEDLNENLGNLLLTKPPESPEHHLYFHFPNLKKTTKLINNPYTKSFLKKLPYKDYFENLIWEPPRRSFAYIKLPEASSGAHRVEMGFTNHLIYVASYHTGCFYQYKFQAEGDEEDRRECRLINRYSLLGNGVSK